MPPGAEVIGRSGNGLDVPDDPVVPILLKSEDTREAIEVTSELINGAVAKAYGGSRIIHWMPVRPDISNVDNTLDDLDPLSDEYYLEDIRRMVKEHPVWMGLHGTGDLLGTFVKPVVFSGVDTGSQACDTPERCMSDDIAGVWCLAGPRRGMTRLFPAGGHDADDLSAYLRDRFDMKGNEADSIGVSYYPSFSTGIFGNILQRAMSGNVSAVVFAGGQDNSVDQDIPGMPSIRTLPVAESLARLLIDGDRDLLFVGERNFAELVIRTTSLLSSGVTAAPAEGVGEYFSIFGPFEFEFSTGQTVSWLLAGALLLDRLGWVEAASLVRSAIARTVVDRKVPSELAVLWSDVLPIAPMEFVGMVRKTIVGRSGDLAIRSAPVKNDDEMIEEDPDDDGVSSHVPDTTTEDDGEEEVPEGPAPRWAAIPGKEN